MRGKHRSRNHRSALAHHLQRVTCTRHNDTTNVHATQAHGPWGTRAAKLCFLRDLQPRRRQGCRTVLDRRCTHTTVKTCCARHKQWCLTVNVSSSSLMKAYNTNACKRIAPAGHAPDIAGAAFSTVSSCMPTHAILCYTSNNTQLRTKQNKNELTRETRSEERRVGKECC